MALSTVTVTVTSANPDQTRTHEIVAGTLAISASPGTYATAGLVVSFAGLDIIKSSQIPVQVDIWSGPAAGTSPSGYIYQYCAGTTRDNGKVTVFQSAGSAAPLAELAAASTPAGVSSDVIKFRAWFGRL